MDELDLQREIAESRRALVEAKRRKAELVSELNELESKAESKRQAYNKIQHEDMLYLLEDEEAVKSSSDLSQLELQFAEANAKLELKILNENIRQQLPILEKNSHKVDRMRKPKTHIVLKTEYKVSDLLQTLPSIVSASVQDLEAQFQMKIEEMSDFKWKINEKIESLKSKRLTLSKNANSMRKDIDALLEERESLRRLLIRLSSSSNLNDYKLQYVTESYLSAREKLQEVHEHGWIGIAFEIGAGKKFRFRWNC